MVDDDAPFLMAVSRLLRAGGYDVRTYASAADFLARRTPEAAGCVVLDLRLPGTGGLEIQTAVTDGDDPLPVIFLTGHGDIPTSVAAMRKGAVDFLTKPVRKEALYAAVSRALEQDAVARRQRTRRRELQARYDALTPREREVLAHVISGQLNKQIADDLGTCERTVKAHRAAIMSKLTVASVAELVGFARELGVQPAGATCP